MVKKDNSMNWKPVPGYENRYEVSDLGLVRSLKIGTLLAQTVNRSGYLFITREWIVGGKRYRKQLLVHRMVYAAFACDTECKIDHIDRDKQNNSFANLRAATPSQNRLNHPKRKDGHYSRYVGVIDCGGRKSGKKFRPRVKKDGKSHFARTFKCETAAAIARDKLAIKLHGNEFISLNFPVLFNRTNEPSAARPLTLGS